MPLSGENEIELYIDVQADCWQVDPGHSDVAFTVRHLMVSKVRGHFTRF
jgi:polyisoprenoid-binding protein YceI